MTLLIAVKRNYAGCLPRILILAYPVVYGRFRGPVRKAERGEGTRRSDIIQNGVTGKLDFGLRANFIPISKRCNLLNVAQVRLIRTKGKLLV